MYFTIKLDRDGWRARFYGANGRLVWWTEGYSSEAGALHAIDLMKRNAASAPIYQD
jgi:uncharacterized protein YegP (UPF0339 family)